MTTACANCGKLNRKNAKFCVACAARLGVEPVGASVPGPPVADADPRLGASFEASRPPHSRPMPLRTAPPAREPAMFWLRAGLAGLVLLIGFVGWCVYIMTSHRGVPPLQASTNAPPAAIQPTATTAPVADAIVAPIPAAAPPSTAMPPTHRAVAESRPAAPSSPASGTEADAGIAVAPARAADAARSRQVSRSRERSRRPGPSDEEALPSNFGWVEPSRPPANTSMPAYTDAGPPVVPGPGPRYASSVPAPAIAAPSYYEPAPSRGADLGPPIAPGPGPRFDFSSPGAIPR